MMILSVWSVFCVLAAPFVALSKLKIKVYVSVIILCRLIISVKSEDDF